MSRRKKTIAWLLCALMMCNLCLPVFAQGELCAHEKTEELVTKINLRYEAGESDTQHTVFFQNEHVQVCEACKEEISAVIGEEESASEIHTYPSGGDTCSVCGHVCQHTHPNPDERMVDEKFFLKDTKTHTKHEIYDVYTTCNNCGKNNIVPVERVEKEIEEPHRFYYGNCVCGYRSHCIHANTEHREEADGSCTYWTILNNEEHTIHLKLDDMIYCTDCGQCLSREGSRYTEEVGAHQFWSNIINGVPQPESCTMCGYLKACEHPSRETVIKEGDTTTFGADASGCILHGNLFYNEICAVCKGVLSTRVAEDVVRHQPHQFVDGKCEICYYKYNASCPHAQRKKEFGGFFNTPKLINIDSEGHTYLGNLQVFDMCLACNASVGFEIQNDTPHKEPHNFSDGVCMTCGYKQGSMTPAPTATPAPEDVYIEATPRPKRQTPAPDAEPTAPPAPVVDVVKVAHKPPAEAIEDMGSQIETQQQDAARQVAVHIVNLEKIATEQEAQALKALPVKDQLLVLVSAIGHANDVEIAKQTDVVSISRDASTLIETMAQRIQTMDKVERTAFEQVLKESFAVERVEKNGVWQEYFVIELMITVDGISRVERYGFRFDGKTWEFTLLGDKPAA